MRHYPPVRRGVVRRIGVSRRDFSGRPGGEAVAAIPDDPRSTGDLVGKARLSEDRHHSSSIL